jgi:hypothetical protein
LLFVFCSFLFFINFRVGLIEDLHHHEASWTFAAHFVHVLAVPRD